MNEVSAATGKSPRAGGDTSDELQIPSDEPDEGRVAPEGFTPDLLKPEPDRPRGTGRSMEREVVSKSPDQRLDLGKNRPSDLGGSASQTPELPAGMMSEQSGWQAAARRLKELGIRKYRLESQIENQTFTFMCTFTSQDNARIVRKFEAEADTPLEAVQQALEQIDDWRARGSSDKIAALPQED
ncbi:MAG: hypothetical protein ACM3U2_02105 [Deltaproteobacteria bacterium]